MLSIRSAVHWLGNIGPLLTGLCTAPLTARALGVDDRGTAALIMALGGIAGIVFAFGLGWRAREQLVSHSATLGEMRFLARRTSVAMLPLALVLAGGLAVWQRLDFVESCSVILYFGAASFAADRAVDGNALIVTGEVRRYGLANLAFALVVGVAIVALFFSGHLSLFAVVSVNAAGILVQGALLNRYVAHAYTRGSRKPPRRARRKGRYKIREFYPAFLAQVLDGVNLRVDVVVVAIVGTQTELGLYSILVFVTGAVYGTSNTLVQRSYASYSGISNSDRLRKLLKVLSLCGCVTVVVTIPVMYFLIPPVFGQGYVGSRYFLIPLAVIIMSVSISPAVVQDMVHGEHSLIWPVVGMVSPFIVGVLVGLAAGALVALVSLGLATIAFQLLYSVISGRLARHSKQKESALVLSERH